MIFDGSSIDSMKKSLTEILRLNEEELIRSIVYYYCDNISTFDNNEFLYDDFIDYIGLDDKIILYDEIFFFHSLSVIDELESLKMFGLVNLRDSLTKETTFKKYLNKKGVFINLQDKIEIIYNNRIEDLSLYNEDEASDNEYWKVRAGEYLYHRLSFDYNINGFLFLNNILRDSSYFSLMNESEFFTNIKDFTEDINILEEWRTNSKWCILKCRVKTGQATLGDGFKWRSEDEEAKIFTKKLIELAIRNIINVEIRKDELLPIEYVLLRENISIPFSDIKVIDGSTLGVIE